MSVLSMLGDISDLEPHDFVGLDREGRELTERLVSVLPAGKRSGVRKALSALSALGLPAELEHTTGYPHQQQQILLGYLKYLGNLQIK